MSTVLEVPHELDFIKSWCSGWHGPGRVPKVSSGGHMSRDIPKGMHHIAGDRVQKRFQSLSCHTAPRLCYESGKEQAWETLGSVTLDLHCLIYSALSAADRVLVKQGMG